jgi:TatD DNase family protein
MMKPKLVDFHCHLDLYPDHVAAIAECDLHRVATLAVTTTPKAFTRNQEMASRSEYVRVALGLHPQLVEERASEIDLFENLLSETQYVGEVGLDAGKRHYRSFEQQKDVFIKILKLCSRQGGKVISIHSVRSGKQVIDCLEAQLDRDTNVPVLHWFTGSRKDVDRAVTHGSYFSVNEAMLATPAGQKVARHIPLERLLTETDGPLVETDGRPIWPGEVGGALSQLAVLRGMDAGQIATATLRNLRTLLARVMV